ncbi:hypothetical protein ACA910_021509 [Epithemia clementina (nom. ined.)]
MAPTRSSSSPVRKRIRSSSAASPSSTSKKRKQQQQQSSRRNSLLKKTKPTATPKAVVPDVFAIGTRVRKYFESVSLGNGRCTQAGCYEGRVESVLELEDGLSLYHIVYEDGDQEDMEHAEVREAHAKYQRFAQTHSKKDHSNDNDNEEVHQPPKQKGSAVAKGGKLHATTKKLENDERSSTTEPSTTTGEEKEDPLSPMELEGIDQEREEPSVGESENEEEEEEEQVKALSISPSHKRASSVPPETRRRSPRRTARGKVKSYAESDEDHDDVDDDEEVETKQVPVATIKRPRRAKFSPKASKQSKPHAQRVVKRQVLSSDDDDHEEEEWSEKVDEEDDALDYEDDIVDEDEEEEDHVQEDRKSKRKTATTSSNRKKATPAAAPPPPTSWKVPPSATQWDKASVYDHDWEIPSDAEDEILKAAESSEVSVLVARHNKSKSHDGNQRDDRHQPWAQGNKSADATDPKRHKQPEKPLYTAGDHLPVLSQPQQMFDHMVRHLISLEDPFQAPDKKKDAPAPIPSDQATGARQLLLPLLQALRNRPLKVATMCSGTESPILALDMLQKSLEDVCVEFGLDQDLMMDFGSDGSNAFVLPIEHVFSCEIEPFKQAYIERNFRPPLLFRDIRELGQEEAYTAYGALAKVPNTPGRVDLLIAGTSCVDYSNLNNRKKTISQKGESGQTFWGMMDWIDKAQPPIVIIENVCNAPWEAKVEIFQERGYAATFKRLDTKDYYIPHTRNRGYLFAVKQPQCSKVAAKSNKGKGKKPSSIGGGSSEVTTQWSNMLAQLKRPASASLDAFMLPNEDPRVLRGRARLTAESCDSNGGEADRAGRTDWTKCETRHQFARSSEDLGEKRPLTGWSDSGNTVMPAFAWNEWTNAQVHRIHDLMDINTLRLAKGGIDCTYKTMVWNLSQNVDRDTMGKLGLCQCLTPTGVPYVTNRGGPLVGEELLLLQGIPADDLLFTKESEANLKDLAGNAMSTTVVGAVTLCALLLGYESLGSRSQVEKSALATSKKEVGCQSLVPRPLQQSSREISIERVFGEYQDETIHLGSTQVNDWPQLLRDASWSSRKCYSEGENESLSVESLVICSECGETCGRENSVPPRRYEEHNFKPLNGPVSRKQPSVFRQELVQYLPMLVTVAGVRIDNIEIPQGVKTSLWRDWKEQVQASISNRDGTLCTFRFARLQRTRQWTAHYVSDTSGARLEVRFHGKEPYGVSWFLFTKTPLLKSSLRSWLEKPVARLVVSAPNGHFPRFLTQGHWELCLPTSEKVRLHIRGTGDVVNSWRSRLGLKGQFESERQFETMQISVLPEQNYGKGISDQIEGIYRLLPKCGGACGSLMKKETADGSTMFLFFDSGRKSLASSDQYVFANTCHRTSSDEHREVHLTLSRDFNPLFDGNKYAEYETTVDGETPGVWLDLPESFLCTKERAGWTTSAKICKPVGNPNSKVVLSMEGWKVCAEIVACTVPIARDNKMLQLCLRHDCLELNMIKSKSVLESLAFMTSRLSIPNSLCLGESEWISLDRSSLEQCDGDDALCDRCAPKRPFTQWTIVEKGKQRLYLPVEDGREAAVYEQLLKHRPRAWVLRLVKCASPELRTLRIGCNAVSLVQRAYGYFPGDSLVRRAALDFAKSSSIRYDFRIVHHIDRSKVQFEPLTFTSNKFDKEASQPPHFVKYRLRKEQLRSLSWMLKQESSTDPFLEEEVTEEILPSLNWRAEGRVQRPVLVRGGIIADEVGYGKTAITLGLVDSAPEVPKPPRGLCEKLIPTKATLVVVPGHLMGQWPDEVKKFLGGSKRVVNLEDMKSLGNTSIGAITNADIVIVSFKLLCNETYFKRLARLVGIKPDSFPRGGKGGRLFDAVYCQCLSLLPDRVSHIQEDCRSVYDAIEEDAKNLLNEGKNGRVRLDGKKAIYKAHPTSSKDLLKVPQVEKGERNPWNLSGHMNSFERMNSPPLESFFWNRIVVDEFTYLVDTERERVLSLLLGLKSSFRWCLSGTPQHTNFNDIKTLGTLLGLHLGVDETLPGVKLGPGRGQKVSENTGLENLSQFLEVRSMQWHERRHRLVQSFMDRYVRQNVAEVNEIPSEEHVYRLNLPPAERAIYLELETHLKSLDMNSKNAQKSKNKSRGDRDSRMQKILRESQNAEEALLKACTHYDMDKNGTTASEKMSDVIQIRKSELKRLEREIIEGVASCFRQHHRILALQPDWNQATKVEKGEVASALNAYLSEVEESRSVSHGADEDVHDRIRILAKLAEAAFKTNPLQKDERFEEVNDGVIQDSGSKQSAKTKKEASLESLYPLKRSLHNYMFTIRSYGKELCGRIRSLRFVEHVHALQVSNRSFKCARCHEGHLTVDDVAILTSCGHFGCKDCLQACASEGKCIEHPRCSADVSLPHVISSKRLNLKVKDDSRGQYGCKLTAVVQKVKEIIEAGDRVLVFSQFDDLKDKVAEALMESGMKTIQVKGSVKHQVKSLSVFQKEKPSSDDPRILLLKMDDEQSAGLNLTNLNHAIFVHPLLAGSQQQYDAYETQAIGRIRRYGQKKTVYVHRFLVTDTIDTEIYNERGGRSVNATTGVV